jgi:uncharacterized membrane protein YqhA
MMNKVYKTAITIISLVMFFNFLLTTGIGVYKTAHAVYTLFTVGTEGRPGIEVLESLDLFLVAFVFLILSLSFISLFHPESKLFKGVVLPWLKIDDFFKLKHITWNAILLTLVIIFGTQVMKGTGQTDWNVLVVPIAVLLFAASAKLLKH